MRCVACGYYLEEKRLAQLNQFLDERKVPKIDEKVLVQVLTHLKELELMNEQENESDEYCKCLGFYKMYSGCVRGSGRSAEQGGHYLQEHTHRDHQDRVRTNHRHGRVPFENWRRHR